MRALTQTELNIISGGKNAAEQCMDNFPIDDLETGILAIFAGAPVCGIVGGIEIAMNTLLGGIAGSVLGAGAGMYFGSSIIMGIAGGLAGGYMGGYLGLKRAESFYK